MLNYPNIRRVIGFWGSSSSGRAIPLHGIGGGFKSCLLHVIIKYGSVVELGYTSVLETDEGDYLMQVRVLSGLRKY